MFARIKQRMPRLLLELAILLAVVIALEAFLTRDAVRGKAPEFVGVTIGGAPFALSSLRGQPALVHFWATWCPVCQLEQGTIDSLADGYPVITVAMQSGDTTSVQAYMDEEGVAYPVINDPDGTLARRYGVSGVPAGFVLDSEGRVRFVTHGYTSALGLRVRLWLADML